MAKINLGGRFYAVAAAVVLSVGGMTGCTTMQMLDEAGDSMSKGDVGRGVFQGVTGLVFGPVIDVFTLGGTIDSPEKMDQMSRTASSIARGAAANNTGAKAQQYQALATALQGQTSDQAPSAMTTQTGSLPKESQSSHNFKYANPVDQCVKTSSHGSRAFLSNTCGFEVHVFGCTNGGMPGTACRPMSPTAEMTFNLRPNTRPEGLGSYYDNLASFAWGGGNFVYIACKDPFFPYITAWNGNRYTAVCRAY